MQPSVGLVKTAESSLEESRKPSAIPNIIHLQNQRIQGSRHP
jgi:hypothetical protein